MDIQQILNDKTLKAKDKTLLMSKMLSEKKVSMDKFIQAASTLKDPDKASCIEAIEYATKINPAIANKNCLDFVIKNLYEKAPRIKWESAKVIGNIASRFPKDMNPTLNGLLDNAEHEGTVVRWSAAFALGEIVKLNLPMNKNLLPAIEAVIENEEKNSIKKIYAAALKTLVKKK